MKNAPHRDLETVRAELQAWRAQRKGRERIPEKIWKSAIMLLDMYPFHKVCKELSLNSKQLKKRAEVIGKPIPHRPKANKAKAAQQNSKPKQAFLEFAAGDLINRLPVSDGHHQKNGSEQTCRIMIERADGNRLSLHLPIEWSLIQSICNGFIKA